MYPHRLVAVLTVASLAALGGCSNFQAQSETITVPVLWAGTDAAGNPTAGVEDAGVSVADDGQPGFSVDLSDTQAQGAGPSWQAASATAATVGTLFSAANPADVSVRFTVTGPIDGPSGGAALAVGVLASLRHQQLKPGVTMTGTLAPDGTIGYVSSIPEKIRAAGTAGYATVLVPFVALGRASSGHYETPEAAAKASGVNLIGVRDLGEAYREFTGSSIEPAVTPLRPSATQLSTQRMLAQALITRARTGLSLARGVSASVQQQVDAGLAAATASLNKEPDEAYGIAADSYRLLVGASTQLKTQPQLVAQGNQLRAQCTSTLDQGAATAGLASNQQLSLSTALGLLSHCKATLSALNQDLATHRADADFIKAAAVVLAGQRAVLSVFYPDQLTLIKALVPNDPSAQSAATFISGYTNFLVAAGRSNEEYVAAQGRGADSAKVAGEWGQTVKILGEQAQSIPSDEQSLPDEARQAADSLAYYLASSWQLSADQTLRLSQVGHVSIPPETRNALTNSAATADETVNAFTSQLAAENTDAGYASWLAGVGVGATSITLKRDAIPADIAAALTYSWAGTTNVLMVAAAP